MIEPEILLKCNIPIANINFEVSKQSNREINQEIEKDVDHLWNTNIEQARKRGVLAYDGNIYRFEDYKIKDNALSIKLSPQKYRHCACFRSLPYRKKLTKSAYPNSISIGTLLKTTDNKYIFGVRNGKTLSPTSIDLLGGMLERRDSSKPDPSRQLMKELKEEANIDQDNIGEIQFIGIITSPYFTTNTICHTTLNIDSEQFLKLTEQREDPEMRSFKLVDKKRLKEFLKRAGYTLPRITGLLDSTF